MQIPIYKRNWLTFIQLAIFKDREARYLHILNNTRIHKVSQSHAWSAFRASCARL